MRTKRTFASMAVAIALAASAGAQDRQSGGTVEDQFVLPVPAVEAPPRDFKTAEEHYNFLLERANGGTKHTMQTIPVWDGLWGSGNNTMPSIFLVNGTLANAWRPGATQVKEGVLTPAYEQHFRARRAEIDEYGEQRYDRLTNCEYPGVPRWLWEPYIKEFVHLPHQSWLMNDMMNETRRIYIGKEHVNIENTHSPLGDSVGFWDENKLVVWTKWVHPADYVRGMPLTSNQFEMVETWEERRGGDKRELVTQVTFYDPIALVKPQSAVYVHEARPDLEEAGVRIRMWECTTSSNSYKDAEGNTQFYLPGDPQYKDPRGSTDFPELPGQSLNPIFDEEGAQQ
jgi:hypothetical protein